MIDSKNDKSEPQNVSDFSIDHILNRAGNNFATTSASQFPWLHCTRYCPPRLPRVQRKEAQRRQLGRHPRIPFTSHQLSVLEDKYQESPYLSSEQVTILSEKLNLADVRVKIWFQNRRARERRERAALQKPEEVEESSTTSPQNFVVDPSNVYFLAGNVNERCRFRPPGILPNLGTIGLEYLNNSEPSTTITSQHQINER